MPTPLTGYLLVAIGGAAGALLRHALGLFAGSGYLFPWATLGINIAGSLAIGLAWGAWSEALWFQNWGRLLIVVGLLGGFTTFSAFSYETLMLIQNGRWLASVGYVLASVIVCLGATALGYRVGSGFAGG